MSTHKHIDRICCVVLAFTLVLSLVFINAEFFGVQKVSAVMKYENKLFDTSKVHTINIIMDDWDDFIQNCKSEKYYNCTLVIDNDACKNVAIRGKGNTSLTQVDSYGNNRYSFKIEFDHYDSTNTYYGLDKLCLNNIIQDNTYMKDYLTYQMMNKMGVASPLCSYAYITVNGEDWGLYLAVEGIEESFLQRSYGKNYGSLYKPDSMDMGDGNNEKEPQQQDTNKNSDTANSDSQNSNNITTASSTDTNSPNENNFQDRQIPENNFADKKDMRNGSDDVLLKYIDDNVESYSNIFNNAKTKVSDSDKTRLIKSLKKLNSKEDLEDTVDINSVIRYFVVHNFVLNFDSYTGSMIHNYYLYENDGQLQMIPWDYNLAFGGFQSMGNATSLVNYPIDSPVSNGSVEDRPMIAWIFENEEYTNLYHQYFSEFISEYFDNGYFENMIDNVTEMISSYVEKDPTKFCTYDEFEKGISTLKNFCLLRAKSISGQLDGTIGSTSETQKTDTLISAENINISDMGSMGNNMGGDMPNNNMQKPENNGNSNTPPSQSPPSDSSNDTSNSSETPSDNNSSSTDNNQMQQPNGQMGGGAPPDFANGENDNTNKQGEFNGQMQKPNNNAQGENNNQNNSQSQTSVSTDDLILIGASTLILILGIGFALFYKRRK